MNSLETVTVETGPNPTFSIIWMHGLGADGHDFELLVPELLEDGMPTMRFVFPHAPVRPVTINNGMRMRAWYDILQFGDGPEDQQGIRASQVLLENLIIAEKKKGIQAGKIVLAGFSQGGAIVLQTGLRHAERLAGILALSTYLPIAETLQKEKSKANQDLPIFMAHGSYDDIIPIKRAEDSRNFLEQLGYRIEWHGYPMPHSVCGEEIGHIASFLTTLL